MTDLPVRGKRVLLRLDINSPIDRETKRIVNENRIERSLDTVRWLRERGARVAIIAHQGDTLDYEDVIPLSEHAEILSRKLGSRVTYIDDVCGPAARVLVTGLGDGDCCLLGNLRYLAEEMSTFENSVKLRPPEMLQTYLVRSLAPLFDFYVNDAFSAAHRNAPSMVAFQELLPSAAGPLFFAEMTALDRIMTRPVHPATFLLGGAKISDAFSMMSRVLERGVADHILTCGVTGEVFLIASGVKVGGKMDAFLSDRGLTKFIGEARSLLEKYGSRIRTPLDLAYVEEGVRREVAVEDLPKEVDFVDVGEKTILSYEALIAESGMVFVNGPAGIYEKSASSEGTRRLWKATEEAKGFTVVGGGDSVTAAAKFCDPGKFGYICTAGGAMVRYLSGRKLPLVVAMREAYAREGRK